MRKEHGSEIQLDKWWIFLYYVSRFGKIFWCFSLLPSGLLILLFESFLLFHKRVIILLVFIYDKWKQMSTKSLMCVYVYYVYIFTYMDIYVHNFIIKRNKLLVYVIMWMHLKNIILNKKTDTENDISYGSSFKEIL